jgi:hypothetical protein
VLQAVGLALGVLGRDDMIIAQKVSFFLDHLLVLALRQSLLFSGPGYDGCMADRGEIGGSTV